MKTLASKRRSPISTHTIRIYPNSLIDTTDPLDTTETSETSETLETLETLETFLLSYLTGNIQQAYHRHT